MVARSRLRLRPPVATACALFVFASLLYANSASNGFVLDDQSLVADNPAIRSLGNLPTLFASDYSTKKSGAGLYRPLVTSSYALNFALGGQDPSGYHLANIGLHALVCVLVWALYRQLVGDALLAGAAAFLFAAHAVHTEAVANVAGRAELLAALFFLLALLAHIRGRERGHPSVRLYAASLGTYLLALLSKENAITLLGVLFLYDFLYASKSSKDLGPRLWGTLHRYGRAYGGYVLVTLLYLALRWVALGATQVLPPPLPMDNPLVTLDLPWHVLNALQVALRYLGLLLFPLHLSYDYSYDQIPLLTSLAEPATWIVLALCVGLIGIALWAYRVSTPLFFALGFYLVTFFVVSNLGLPIGTIMGERLVYLPSLGFCLAAILVLEWACTRSSLAPRTARALFLGLLTLLVGLHAARTVVRGPDWQSNERLYLHDVQVVPRSNKALINAAYALGALNREDEAIAQLERQIRRGAAGPVLHNNLGYLLVEHEIDVTRGVRLLERAVAGRPNDPEFLDSLAWGYYKLGRLVEARDLLRRSLALDDWSHSTQARRAHLESVEQSLTELNRSRR